MALYHFARRRASFAKHIAASTSALTPGRYFRLMAMAVVEMFWSLTMFGLNMWFAYRSGLRPWTGWADVHWNFSRIGQFPAVFIPEATLRWSYFLWWSIPVTSYVFIAFFICGRDTLQEYSGILSSLQNFGRRCLKERFTNKRHALHGLVRDE